MADILDEYSDYKALDIDFAYEESVTLNPYNFLSWWQYLQAKVDSDVEHRFWIYERALLQVPGSYKLWYNYLTERVSFVQQLPINHEAYDALINVFQRSLVFMNKMPRIWLKFLHFLIHARRITITRRTFDNALRSLPVTQHERIWPLYIKFVRQSFIPNETTIRIFRRYLKVYPEEIEKYIDFLCDIEEYGEATRLLAKILNNDKFVSTQGRSKHDLWIILCDLCSKYPEKVTIRLEPVIRTGLKKFTSEVGKLWVSLAQYYIRLGNFPKAHDIFEEGIQSVITIRDFSLIYEAYTEFSYGLITAHMEKMNKKDNKNISDDKDNLNLIIARYEDLIDRQQILISDVLLRQNPNNVGEWHNRISLFEDDPKKQVEIFTEAIKTIDPLQASGNLYTIWTRFAKFWEDHKQLESARKVFSKATEVNFKRADHLANVWCEYIEMEIRNGNYDMARNLAQQATAVPSNYKTINKTLKSIGGQELTSQQKLFRQIRIWSLYADLEESFGTFESLKAIYEKIIELKIATPLIILNYAKILEEKKLYEDSFRVYEKGVDIFKYPHVLDIWTTYLTKFIEVYEGTKLERTRDLFEQAIETVPSEYAKIIYLMYAEFEEKQGILRNAMMIYDRATKAVPEEERPKIFNVYIAKAGEFFGITRTKEIFESAIESLSPKYVPSFCLRFAKLERRLGDENRARAIYTHGAQFCDPRIEMDYWKTWKEFEETYFNVEAFKEMLRIRKSVIVQYNNGSTALST